MFTCNSRFDRRLRNGTLGEVVGFAKPSDPSSSPWDLLPRVKFCPPGDESFTMIIYPQQQELYDHSDDPDSPVTIYHVFLPLLAAEALTIHKSVGSNLPAVTVDLTGVDEAPASAMQFAPHLLYEALSRTPSLAFTQLLLPPSPRALLRSSAKVDPSAASAERQLVHASQSVVNQQFRLSLGELLKLSFGSSNSSASASSSFTGVGSAGGDGGVGFHDEEAAPADDAVVDNDEAEIIADSAMEAEDTAGDNDDAVEV